MRHGCLAPHTRLTLLSLIVLVLVLLPAPTALASGTWYVDGVHGKDSNDCKTPRSACKTIGHAISLASSGDTISVAAATYTENLTINFSLTIHGDFATSAPTIIDGGGVNTVVTIPNAGTNITLSKLTIRNGFTNGNGGGIANNGTLTISYSIISGNNAGFGGGGISNNGGTVTISNSTLTGNSAIAGGGIDSQFGALAITKSTVSKNRAVPNTGAGGGIYGDYSPLTINNSTISGNSAGDCGGICNFQEVATITNSTLNGNKADTAGGGIQNGYGATLTINNSTISGNGASPGNGGGIDVDYDSAATLQNSIVANSSSGGNCHLGAGSIVSNGYNLSSDGTCPFNNTGDLNNTDPKLGPLQNNGGPTWTQSLLDGSPAIDAGNPSGCTDGNGNLLKTDQRGFPRLDPEDPSGCDMGAYERQGD